MPRKKTLSKIEAFDDERNFLFNYGGAIAPLGVLSGSVKFT